MVLLTGDAAGQGRRDETDDADRVLALLLTGCAGKRALSIATDTSWTPVIRRRVPIRE